MAVLRRFLFLALATAGLFATSGCCCCCSPRDGGCGSPCGRCGLLDACGLTCGGCASPCGGCAILPFGGCGLFGRRLLPARRLSRSGKLLLRLRLRRALPRRLAQLPAEVLRSVRLPRQLHGMPRRRRPVVSASAACGHGRPCAATADGHARTEAGTSNDSYAGHADDARPSSPHIAHIASLVRRAAASLRRMRQLIGRLCQFGEARSVGKPDPRVDAYIAKSAPFARPILDHLRRVVHAACPAVEETIKWGFPHFMYKGMLCNMAAFKQHCAFGFWHKGMKAALSRRQAARGDGTTRQNHVARRFAEGRGPQAIHQAGDEAQRRRDQSPRRSLSAEDRQGPR